MLLAKGLIELDSGGIPKLPEFQKELLKFYCINRKEFHLNIQIPVGHGKTTLVTDVIQIHEKTGNMNHTLLYLSETDGVAKLRLGQIIKKLIQYGEMVNKPFVFKEKNARDFDLKDNKMRDPSGQARGITSSYTGSHVESIILDDIETLDTLPIMDEVIEAMNTKVNKRLSPTGKMCAVNTPYSKNGIVSILEQRNSWLTLKIHLPEDLIVEHTLSETIKFFENEADLKEPQREKVLEFLFDKLVFNAIKYLKPLLKKSIFESYENRLMECLDFRYRMKIIERGEVIEERILPQWDFLIEKHGAEILDSYIYTNQSYLQTYALTADSVGATGFFTHCSNAMKPLEEILKLEFQPYKRVFSYDLSMKGRAGTVITECNMTEKEFIIKGQTATTESITAVKNNIAVNPDALHLIEGNSWQRAIIDEMLINIPEEIHKNILIHITPSKPHEVLGSKLSMNLAFASGEIVFYEDGKEIKELIDSLNSFKGIKKGKDQFDNIDSLWMLWHNRDMLRTYTEDKAEVKPKRKKIYKASSL